MGGVVVGRPFGEVVGDEVWRTRVGEAVPGRPLGWFDGRVGDWVSGPCVGSSSVGGPIGGGVLV